GDADRRGRRPLGELREEVPPARDDRRPVGGPRRLAAGRPREQQLVDRLGDLVPRELEHVLLVLQEAVVGEEGAELTKLVPPARQEPVVAIELVLLDVREDRARERQELVEGLA